MSFEYAPVCKGLMVSLAISSLLVGVFDVKHYFHLQLVPHISRYYQYWRLPTHHLAFSSSGDLFIAELILFNIGVQVERQFGSLKFASFAVISAILSTALEFLTLLLFHRAGLNHIPAGPATLIFSILYQHARIVPSAYDFRIFGLPLTNKSFTYLFALQLALSHLPGSLAAAMVGILTGQIYRSDITAIKSYRLPPGTVSFAQNYLFPLLGSLRAARRSNRAYPDAAGGSNNGPLEDEVITTARPTSMPPRNRQQQQQQPQQPEGSGSVVREWVQGITGRSPAAGVRIPTEAEIGQLTTMFPGIRRGGSCRDPPTQCQYRGCGRDTLEFAAIIFGVFLACCIGCSGVASSRLVTVSSLVLAVLVFDVDV
ncbi:DSC E3 ubiquitin ligase complex subunit 2 [Mycena indigotica]|uniref:DSC E3 ubiquitin ligase complex subunit 2 n=1 Tax=Mycena indigotica TaxID=2126181 RepID=A0A8H6W476_9AGAR|nr:DSC E3 ubiquitin ligase complex subunit 2 [Mycena indigotica]KAF7302266.1 DSC E3 ubiquitin ligase complex subunit 2 [Mycena indigotica]